MATTLPLPLQALRRWVMAPHAFSRGRLLQEWTHDWGGRLIFACGLHVLFYMSWYVFKWGPPEAELLIADLAIPPVNLAAAILAWRASRSAKLTSQTRRAWRIVCLAFLSYWAGNVLWFYHEVVLEVDAFPSLADAGFLPFYPLLLWGLLSFPIGFATRSERFRFALDAGIMLLGGGMVIWYFFLLPTTQVSLPPAATGLLLAYVAMDLILFLGISAVMLRQIEESSRAALGILVIGLVLFFCADLGFAYLNLHSEFQGGDWPDWFWLGSVFLMALSAQYQHWQASSRQIISAPEQRRGPAFTWLPYLAVVIGYSLLLAVTWDEWTETLGYLVISAGALTGLVLARQVMTVRENSRLVAEAAMRQSEARFRALVQRSSDVILVIGSDTTIHYHTPSAERLFGQTTSELIGAHLVGFFHPDDQDQARSLLTKLMLHPESSLTLEGRLLHHDGSWRHIEAVGANLFYEADIRGIVLNARDVTERKGLESQLSHLAFHDSLTRLANRYFFHQRLDQTIREKAATASVFAVLFLDIDNFKTVNDTLGHAAGDELLLNIARRLQTCVRDRDMVARLGGDEFAILVEALHSQDEALRLADRLVETLQIPFQIEGSRVVVSASIGVVITSTGQETADDILRNADIAMYAAKRQGKGVHRVFKPRMHALVMERWALASELRSAVEQQALDLHYQPIVDLRTNSIVGVEALVRWNHPQRGQVSPATFIPLAEENDLIFAIDRWVLERACRQVRLWQTQYHAHSLLFVSVNLSARQLQHADFLDDVAQVLQDSQLDAHSLVLELTEHSLMENTRITTTKLQQLKSLGVRLAIDDFGTGYSSLNYLQQFPVNILKIDRAFLDTAGAEPDKPSLTQAIVLLGRMLDLQTVAEGIETAQQLAMLREFGCVFGQGFHLAQPGDAATTDLLLRQKQAVPARMRKVEQNPRPKYRKLSARGTMSTISRAKDNGGTRPATASPKVH